MAPAHRQVRIVCLLWLLAMVPLSEALGQEQEASSVWLLTYGPGELSWERFGHNAIWVRDQALGLDHTFNFGFFDFRQENFFRRFLLGKMLYFSAAQPARDEFAAYINANRGIRAQKLALSGEQKLALIEYLVNEARPENRDYLYDYYNNNCSTRVRDALDAAMGGQLSREFGATQMASQTWRDHTRRLTQDDYWLYLGLEIVLGAPVDRAINRWQEMFIPGILAQTLPAMVNRSGRDVQPWVVEDVILYASTRQPPVSIPQTVWPRYLPGSLAILILAWAAGRFFDRKCARYLSRSWLIVNGLAGLALLFFWFGTDHAVARLNLNVLVFCPLWLPLAVWKGKGRLLFYGVALLSALALIMYFLPPHQYTLDVLAAILPLNLAAAYCLRRD